MKKAVDPWTDKLVLICKKCGEGMCKSQKNYAKESGSASCDVNPAEELKKHLKNELKSIDLWGTHRVVTTSCLNLCPKDAVAVCIQSKRTHELWEVDPVKDRDKILEAILRR